MNAGDVVEVNNFAGAPVSKATNRQCGPVDGGKQLFREWRPALSILNAAEQSIDNVSFATVVSTVINQHFLNVIVETASIPTVSRTATPSRRANSPPSPPTPLYSWASLSIGGEPYPELPGRVDRLRGGMGI